MFKNCYKKSLFILLILCCCFSNISRADEQNEALFDVLQTGGKALQQKQLNSLNNYSAWWSSLSSRQKQIAYSVDRIEEDFKLNNNGKPMVNSYNNIIKISYLLYLKSPYDRTIIAKRLQQHIDVYEDSQKVEQLEATYNKLKKKIQESSKNN